MEKQINEIAFRIRELRDACGYTAEQLAKELNIDIDVYEGYETNGKDIPISVIYEVATKFGVDFTEIITGVRAKLNTYNVVRKGKGESINRYEGYRFEDLGSRYAHKIMQPLLVTIDPSEKSASLVAHAGQEFNLVIEGTMALVFEDKEIILETGDSVYFNPEFAHGQKCIGDKKARFLTVIAE